MRRGHFRQRVSRAPRPRPPGPRSRESPKAPGFLDEDLAGGPAGSITTSITVPGAIASRLGSAGWRTPPLARTRTRSPRCRRRAAQRRPAAATAGLARPATRRGRARHPDPWTEAVARAPPSRMARPGGAAEGAMSKTYTSTRAPSRSCRSQSLARRPLQCSMYQSAKSPHTNARAASTNSLSRMPASRWAPPRAVGLGRGGPRAASLAAIAASRRARIQWSARVSGPSSCARSSARGHRLVSGFVSRNRPMFHNLVTKLRPGANERSRLSGSRSRSVPRPIPAISVYRSASAP